MGIFFNPGNGSFTKDRNYEIYVDKTELLKYLNRAIGTPKNCIAVSHARRFGKSHAAGMIDAYYSLGSDSAKLFKGTKIASDPDYEKYRNKYNVIHLDISSFWDFHKKDIVEKIIEDIFKELKMDYPEEFNERDRISYVLMKIYKKTGIPFVIIIDEWDCVVRNSTDQDLIHQYLQFLHSLFKSEESKSFLALGYITGIMPIKKIKDESAFGTINNFIMMNYSGLKEDVLTMLSGGKVMVDTECFQNDLAEIHSKDDALTALIHLGYLGYDADMLSAYIPNYEVAKAFQSALKTGEWKDVAASISKCDTLLMATISGNTEKVAELIELAHDTYTSILKYNDENSLSCVLTMAYFTAPAYYTIIREMPAGKGFADFVFLPRANAGNRPAMIVELKYNQSADTVIRQIKEKRYQGALSGYESKILLVGISCDSEKHHTCSIEEW